MDFSKCQKMEKEESMIFWERLRSAWSNRKRKSTLTEIESLRQGLKWSRARLAVKQMPEYNNFREWIEELLFNQWISAKEDIRRDQLQGTYHIGSADVLHLLLDQIESSTSEQIQIDEKNLKTLQGR